MSRAIERTLRVYDLDAEPRPAKPVHYWRSRSPQERLLETLLLHREGNELFKGGNPAFAYVIREYHVAAP